MQYRRLGNSGLKVSALSYGAWVTFGTQIGLDQATALMSQAYDAGVNFFDNAETYADGKAEELMGSVFKKTGWSRDSYIVSSKAFFGAGGTKPTQVGLSRKHLVDACNQALQRLQLDYLDLYYCHRPDDEVPVSEVVETMSNLVRQGKVLYWGTSMWPAKKIEEAYEYAKDNYLVAPTMEQPQYNMLFRELVEDEYKSLYKKYGMGTTTWSPLASGLLTGKYSGGNVPDDSRLALPEYQWLRQRVLGEGSSARLAIVDELKGIADSIGLSLHRMALAWCAANPNVSTVILGATKPEQLAENLKAIEDVAALTPTVMKEIEGVLKGDTVGSGVR